MPFYDKLLTYIPKDIDIILLVKDSSFANDYSNKCLKQGVLIRNEYVEFPDLFDIWVRDYAPLTVTEMGILYPVKFEYASAYIHEKDKKYIRYDHEAGELLGEKFVSKGMNSVCYHWDMGN